MSTEFIPIGDNLRYFYEWISLREWREEWNTCPIQRDHKRRAASKVNQAKFSHLQPDHLEVKGVILGCDCVDPYSGIEYKKGTKFKTDGHTRDLSWEMGICLDGQPEEVHVSYLVVNSIDEVRRIYSMYDAPTDAEKACDRLDGAYRNVFAHKGQYITHSELRKVVPVEYASSGCWPDRFVRARTTNNMEILPRVIELQESILWVQENIFNDPAFQSRKHSKFSWQAAYTTAALMSYLKHKEKEENLIKLKEFMIRVSNMAIDLTVDNADCCSRFISEWSNKDSNYVRVRGLNGSVDSQEMEGFNLLMIDQYIAGIVYEKMPKNWRTYFRSWQLDFIDLEEAREQRAIKNSIKSFC